MVNRRIKFPQPAICKRRFRNDFHQVCTLRQSDPCWACMRLRLRGLSHVVLTPIEAAAVELGAVGVDPSGSAIVYPLLLRLEGSPPPRKIQRNEQRRPPN